MTRLVLINGAPGSGKSTLAALLARDEPLTLAIDIDVIKHSLGRWDSDRAASGLLARRLAAVMVSEHLTSGRDVVIGQFLARTEFIEELESVASGLDADFVEVVLSVDEGTLRLRLDQRTLNPERPEHLVNAALVSGADAPGPVRSIDRLLELRPSAIVIDARGSVESTLQLIRGALSRVR